MHSGETRGPTGSHTSSPPPVLRGEGVPWAKGVSGKTDGQTDGFQTTTPPRSMRVHVLVVVDDETVTVVVARNVTPSP